MEVIGWSGATLYLVAYALVSFRKTQSDSLLFQWMNVIAGFSLTAYNYYLGAYPSAWLNITWAGIAIVTLVRNRNLNQK
jgi:hypothetical protein